MKATCTIHFRDGSTADLPPAGPVQVLDVPPIMRQGIRLEQRASGQYQLSCTAPLFAGKQPTEIRITLEP